MSGKDFVPKRFGPRPIPSSTHSYEVRGPENFFYDGRWMTWIDVWRLRGGSVFTDTLVSDFQRANDLADNRNLFQMELWTGANWRLAACRAELRIQEIQSEIDSAKTLADHWREARRQTKAKLRLVK